MSSSNPGSSSRMSDTTLNEQSRQASGPPLFMLGRWRQDLDAPSERIHRASLEQKTSEGSQDQENGNKMLKELSDMLEAEQKDGEKKNAGTDSGASGPKGPSSKKSSSKGSSSKHHAGEK